MQIYLRLIWWVPLVLTRLMGAFDRSFINIFLEDYSLVPLFHDWERTGHVVQSTSSCPLQCLLFYFFLAKFLLPSSNQETDLKVFLKLRLLTTSDSVKQRFWWAAMQSCCEECLLHLWRIKIRKDRGNSLSWSKKKCVHSHYDNIIMMGNFFGNNINPCLTEHQSLPKSMLYSFMSMMASDGM